MTILPLTLTPSCASFFEVGESAVVGVDDRSGDVAGGRESVESSEDAEIVLVGIAAEFVGVDVLARGPGHQLFAALVEGFDQDAGRFVEEDLVGNDTGLKAGFFKFGGDVEGGLVVLGRTGPVWLGGKSFKVLAGEGGAGNRKEGGVPFGLLGEVAVAEDLIGWSGLGGRRSGLRNKGKGSEERQAGQSFESGQVWGPQK